MPMLLGMMNAVMTAAERNGTEVSWNDIARNFKVPAPSGSSYKPAGKGKGSAQALEQAK